MTNILLLLAERVAATVIERVASTRRTSDPTPAPETTPGSPGMKSIVVESRSLVEPRGTISIHTNAPESMLALGMVGGEGFDLVDIKVGRDLRPVTPAIGIVGIPSSLSFSVRQGDLVVVYVRNVGSTPRRFQARIVGE